jgi:hypothetical protein
MTQVLADAVLAEIEDRCRRTTPGPWKSFVEARDQIGGSDFIQTGGNDIYLTGASADDQDFMACARQDIPLLIAEIRRLQVFVYERG